MPDGVAISPTRDDDPFAWALGLATRLRSRQQTVTAADREALSDFLEEWADEMLKAVLSQLVNLLAHATKAAKSSNRDVIGHWFGECTEFHDELITDYRPSMRNKIDLELVWGRAKRKALASFRDYGEPPPPLPPECPVTIDQLLDPNLDIDWLVETIKRA